MKKYIFLIFFVLFFLLNSCSNSKKIDNKIDEKTNEISNLSLSEKALTQIKAKQDLQDKKDLNLMKNLSKEEKKKFIKERYSILKKRLSLRAIINKWDYYLEHSQPRTALIKYLEVLKKNPEDQEILRKIWDAYFDLKNFKKALEFYLKVKDKTQINKEKFDFALLAWVNLKDKKEKENILKIISLINIKQEEKIYYNISMECIDNFQKCKNDFQNYFKKHRKLWEKMKNIKDAIDRYKKFQAESHSIEQALFIDAFYKNKTFPIVIIMWENLLKQYPWYIPVIKFIWIASYELGFYDRAEENLKKIYSNEPNNPKIAYILWVINMRDWDLIASNLYFSAAIKNGYKDEALIRRKLIFNYSKLWNKKLVLSEFDKLMLLKNININDITLAIYYNILAWKNTKALEYINLWIKKYPKDPVFYAYLWWIYREEWDLKKSEEFLKKGYNMKGWRENPFILLNLWYLEEQKENYERAIVYFAETYSLNMNWEFGSLAKKERKIVEEALRLKLLEEEKEWKMERIQ